LEAANEGLQNEVRKGGVALVRAEATTRWQQQSGKPGPAQPYLASRALPKDHHAGEIISECPGSPPEDDPAGEIIPECPQAPLFSGHTGLAVLGAVELSRICGGRWWILGALVIAFEATTVLVLRAHYTMDVFTGAVAARYATILAQRWAPWCDGWLSGRPGR
jgi:hypothetical protein